MAKRITAAALAASESPGVTANPPGAMGPAVVHMAVAGMVRHPLNARTIQPSPGDSAALRESVRLAGVVQPVLVARMDGDTLGVLAGWQRVSAAQAVGRTTVPAILVEQDDAAQVRLSMLENSLRTPMHPVDAWTMIDTLIQRGSTFDAAVKILGLSQREGHQQRQLARLHPDVLEAMAEHGVPETWDLRQIAMASRERQREALDAGTSRTGTGKKATMQVNWRTVANACRVDRIPRARAMFGDDAGVVFTRDWLAPVGSPEEWTTEDVAGFLAAQRAWMEALVEGNDQALVVDYSDAAQGPAVPRGWTSRQWLSDIPREVPALPFGERFVVCMKPTGEVFARVYAAPAEAHPDAISTPSPAVDAPPPRLITDAGLQMAAEMKQQALADALVEFRKSVPAHDNRVAVLLRALLEAMGAQNVTPGAADKHAPGEAIAEATAEGGEPAPHTLVRIACDTLRDMLVFQAPKVLSSGPIADAIALSLGAEDHLGRFDTPEFLAQCSGTLLWEAAKGVALQPGQKVPRGVAALRAFLVGKLPDWRPITFRAEGVEGNGNG